jgi:hypothetical protein
MLTVTWPVSIHDSQLKYIYLTGQQDRGLNMQKDRKSVLKMLKQELEFLENGGYKNSPSAAWRAAYIFEESPSCPNSSDLARPHRCEDCWLMEFVSPDSRQEQVPCRFVELAPNGITVDSLYRCGTPAESEQELRNWLHQRIRELENEIYEARDLRRA